MDLLKLSIHDVIQKQKQVLITIFIYYGIARIPKLFDPGLRTP